MTYKGKWIMAVNIVIDAAALIYVILLSRYNKILYEIQEQYDSKILQAVNVVKEPDFYCYFFLGIIFAALLIGVSVWDYRSREELWIWILVLMAIHIIILVALVIAYSNPIFTTFITLLTVAGVWIAVIQ